MPETPPKRPAGLLFGLLAFVLAGGGAFVVMVKAEGHPRARLHAQTAAFARVLAAGDAQGALEAFQFAGREDIRSGVRDLAMDYEGANWRVVDIRVEQRGRAATTISWMRGELPVGFLEVGWIGGGDRPWRVYRVERTGGSGRS